MARKTEGTPMLWRGVRVTPSSISKGTYKAPSPKTKCGSVKNDA